MRCCEQVYRFEVRLFVVVFKAPACATALSNIQATAQTHFFNVSYPSPGSRVAECTARSTDLYIFLLMMIMGRNPFNQNLLVHTIMRIKYEASSGKSLPFRKNGNLLIPECYKIQGRTPGAHFVYPDVFEHGTVVTIVSPCLFY